MASSSSKSVIKFQKGIDMDLGEKGKKFVCPNYPSHYFPGILILPKDFCLEVSANVPEKILLHVPPGLVWSAIYSKEGNCIQGLHNFMIYYSVKPYYLIALEYMGGPDFNMQIYNPYGVEINYIVRSPCKSCYADGKFFNFSDIEVDRLAGIMRCNVYSSRLVVYDLVITKKHLTNKEYTKVLKRSACKTLGIGQSMESVDLSFKDFSWTVKLKWENGKAYMDSKWYDFAKAGNLNEGDICAFHLTGEPGKYRICIYESVLLSRCNEKGIGHRTGVLNWYKVVDDIFLYAGQMEIPRVYTEITGGGMKKNIKFIMGDRKSVSVHFFAGKNLIYGLENLVESYYIELNDILVFTYASDSTFVVSCFKSSGIEYHHNSKELSTVIEGEPQGTIMVSDSSDASDNNLFLDHGAEEVEEMIMEVQDEEQDNNTFLVTLKKSHVDKKVHGVYIPRSFYPIYNTWKQCTTVTLICGDKICGVTVLRKGNMCRFGCGWTQFTTMNELQQGQTLEMRYVGDKSFVVRIVT